MLKKFTTFSLALLTTLAIIIGVNSAPTFAASPLLTSNSENQLLAQNTLPELPKPDLLPGPNDPNDSNSADNVQDYVTNRLLPAASARLVTIIAFLSILSLIYAGTKYYTSFGDDGQADEAKKIIQYSILGLVVALMSLAIVSIVAAFARFFQ